MSWGYGGGYEHYCVSAVTARAQYAKYSDILWGKVIWKVTVLWLNCVLPKLKCVHGPLLRGKLKYCLKSDKFSLQRMEDFSFSRTAFWFPKKIVTGLAFCSSRGDSVLWNTVGNTIPYYYGCFFIELVCFHRAPNSQTCHWTLQCILSFPGCLEDIIKKNHKINK